MNLSTNSNKATPAVADLATPPAKLSLEACDILRTAVNFARDQGIEKVAVLRAKLHQAYPGREAQVSEALVFWANREARLPGHAR